MSIWDDFRAFDLRQEDRVYEKPERRWGEISKRYWFVGFSDKKLPCRMYDLFDQLYKSQATNEGREYIRSSLRFRDEKMIQRGGLLKDHKKTLVSAIMEKELA